jgi:hypothetical protein
VVELDGFFSASVGQSRGRQVHPLGGSNLNDGPRKDNHNASQDGCPRIVVVVLYIARNTAVVSSSSFGSMEVSPE